MEKGPAVSDKQPFSGKYVDVDVQNPEDLKAYLGNMIGDYSRLLQIEPEKLPEAITDMELVSWHPDEAHQRQFMGTVSLDPGLMRELTTTKHLPLWHKELLSKLNENLTKSFGRIELVVHEISALHVRLDQNVAVRVSVTSTTSDCGVSLETISIDELETALGASGATSIPDGKPSDPYEIALAIAKIMAITSDTVIDKFGDKAAADEQRYSLPIEVPAQSPFSFAKEEMARKAITASAEGETEIPAIENSTRPIGFDMLGGLYRPKDQLRQIAAAFVDRENAARYGIRPTHFILHGPPGTGKTSLVEAFANETGSELISIASTDVIDKYVGESPKLLQGKFDTAYQNPNRQVIFFDELDPIASISTNSTSAAYIEVKRTLQQCIVKTSREYPNIIIAATTNMEIDDIEPALTRSGRLVPIPVDKPNEQERNDVWSTILWSAQLRLEAEKNSVFTTGDIENPGDSFTLYSPDINTRELARHSEKLTGADFEHVLNLARQRCYQHFLQTGEDRQVTQADLIELLQTYHPR